MPQGPTIAVVGGGIAGAAAARELAEVRPDARVLLLEAGDRLGGKLARAEVAGTVLDVGAESMLARRSEGLEAVRTAGLEPRLVHPEPVGAALWTRGALRPLPRTVLGVPSDRVALASSDVLSDRGFLRAQEDRALPLPDHDQSVAAYVGARLGSEVVDRLVEPLLGGVYAGHASDLSLQAAAPAIWALRAHGPRLLEAAAAQVAAAPDDPRPVFAGIEGGIWQLPAALADHPAVTVRTGACVRAVERTVDGFRLEVGSAAAPEHLDVGGVVLATPAAPTARLVRDLAPSAAGLLGDVPYASMAIVTLAVGPGQLPGASGSGFLVPPVDGRTVKASTFSSAKWRWLSRRPDGAVLLRASVGRAGEERTLQRDDADLVTAVVADLVDAVGLHGPVVDSHVQRWGGGLPQYTVGHLDRVARIRSAVAGVPGLAVCGAAYDGVGIPATVGSARRAVRQVLDHLAAAGREGGQ
ncbi:oxygen-dependent protoporphyrinogen oxidase [Mumia flava]|uniref:Coproporphyrinogen III oxidase n=1 Tax=Mumia flava TaxID=1348852 RepID=A0A0B2BDV2_9ACTN|nr:protoporphyrinogen oxidase [Mumia flava]PJJ55912.1 oxygen-dependent protoporphyrinogen oxidase [Mumia flava]